MKAPPTSEPGVIEHAGIRRFSNDRIQSAIDMALASAPADAHGALVAYATADDYGASVAVAAKLDGGWSIAVGAAKPWDGPLSAEAAVVFAW